MRNPLALAVRAFRSLLPPGWSGDRAPYGSGLLSLNTIAGIQVTADKALGYHPIWRAVNLLAGDTARTPLLMYRRDQRGKVEATNHPAYRLLRYRPNPRQSANTWRQMAMGHALLRGNAYSYIERDQFAAPVALWPLDPVLCRPIILDASNAGAAMLPSGVLALEYQSQSRGTQYIPMENILHIAGLGYDGLQGYDVLSYSGNTMGYGLAAQSYSERFFSQSATPRGVLQTDGTMDEEARKNLGISWRESYGGLANAHKVAVLEGGLKFQAISFNARDSQMLEVLQENIVSVANIFGIPASMLGKQTGSVYSTLEANLQSYLAGALEIWLTAWEMECREKLLTEQEKRDDSIVVEFERSKIVVLTMTERANYLKTGLANHPWLTVDEARASLGLNPIPGDIGDTIQVPTNNFAPAGTAPQEPVASTERAAVVEVLQRLRDDACRRMIKRLAHQAKRHRNKAEALAAWLVGMDTENRAVVEDALREPVEALARLDNAAPDVPGAATLLLAEVCRKLTTGANSLELFDETIAQLEAAP